MPRGRTARGGPIPESEEPHESHLHVRRGRRADRERADPGSSSRPTPSCGWCVLRLRIGPAPVPFHAAFRAGRPMGHEFLGVVEETGSAVSTLTKGDFVIPLRVPGQHLRVLPRRVPDLLHPRRLVRRRGRGTAGRSRPSPPGRRHPREVPGSTRPRAAPVAAHPLRRVPDRLPRRPHGPVLAGKTVTVIGDGAVGLSAVLAASSWAPNASS